MSPTFRAAVMREPHAPITIEEVQVPTLVAGSAMLRTKYSEVCGTDVHLHHGRLSGVPYPIIPGHVSVGHLERIHGVIHDIEGAPFREGDLVTFLDVHETCGNCYECLVTKQTTRCAHRRVYGITYGLEDGPLGGWAEQIWMKPGVKILRMPPSVDSAQFIAGGCGLVTSVHAIERADVRLGSSVAILGVGPVGLGAIALSALAGAYPIVAIGAPLARLEAALRMGATHVIPLDIPPEERAANVRSLNGGRGVDVVIEAAGVPEAVSQALDLVRDGGVVTVVGQYTNAGNVDINPHVQINRKHAEIRGCWGSDYSHFHRALQLLAHHGDRMPFADIPVSRYPLHAAGEALAAVAKREAVKAIIDFDFGSPQ